MYQMNLRNSTAYWIIQYQWLYASWARINKALFSAPLHWSLEETYHFVSFFVLHFLVQSERLKLNRARVYNVLWTS